VFDYGYLLKQILDFELKVNFVDIWRNLVYWESFYAKFDA
jgi:hypothetical protein